ncbi:hypothetical protein LINPERHAP1_LOCUS41923 [Linum perenne]
MAKGVRKREGKLITKNTMEWILESIFKSPLVSSSPKVC